MAHSAEPEPHFYSLTLSFTSVLLRNPKVQEKHKTTDLGHVAYFIRTLRSYEVKQFARVNTGSTALSATLH